MDIGEAQKRIMAYAEVKGWAKDGRTFGDHISLIHAELSEALEVFRDGIAIDTVFFERDDDDRLKPEGVPTELADAVIRILHLCGEYSIDFEYALQLKLDYNEGRPYRHGGKLL